METIKRSDFENNKKLYKRASLLKTFSNGSEIYACRVVCPRCNGKGIVYTHVLNGNPVPAIPDSGVCYLCCGEKYIDGKVRVISDEMYAAKSEKQAAKAEAKKQETIQHNLSVGYKPVDFSIAEWFTDGNVRLFRHGYYHVEKETERAVLISFIGDLEVYNDYRIWLPKKAVIR